MSEKQEHEVATREEVLALLTDQARKGSPTAAAALARELRIRDPETEETEDQALVEELDRIISRPDPMAESRGSRKPNSRSFSRRMRLRPERTPVTVTYRCPVRGGPHPRDRCERTWRPRGRLRTRVFAAR